MIDRVPRGAFIGLSLLLAAVILATPRGRRPSEEPGDGDRRSDPTAAAVGSPAVPYDDLAPESPNPGAPDPWPGVTPSAALRGGTPPPGPMDNGDGGLSMAGSGGVSMEGGGVPATGSRDVSMERGGRVPAASPGGAADPRREIEGGRSTGLVAPDAGGRARSSEGPTGGASSAAPGWVGLVSSGAPSGVPGEGLGVTEPPGRTGSGTARTVASADEGPPSGGSADPTPLSLGLVPGRSDLSSGDRVWVSVVLAGGVNVTSVPFHVRFDPGVLEYLGARTGTALLAGGLQPILLASVSPLRPGDLAVGLSLLGSSGTYSGTGTLVHLEFRALAPGHSALDFEDASVRGATGEPLAARFEGCGVRVR